MRITSVTCLTLLFAVFSTEAQQCPGTMVGVGQRSSGGAGMGAGMALYDFVGTTGCTFSVTGTQPPSGCPITRQYAAIGMTFFVRLGIDDGGLGITTNARCIFNCPGGTCRVGADGLPVELIEFDIYE